MAFDPARIPFLNAGYRSEAMDDELLLYDPAGTHIYSFNATAALVLRLCDGQRSSAEITRLLQEGYPEDAERIPGEVEKLLEACAAAGVVEWR